MSEGLQKEQFPTVKRVDFEDTELVQWSSKFSRLDA